MCGGNCDRLWLFFSQHRTTLYRELLAEILKQRVVSSRGQVNPRVVKKKMSKFRVQSRTTRVLGIVTLRLYS